MRFLHFKNARHVHVNWVQLFDRVKETMFSAQHIAQVPREVVQLSFENGLMNRLIYSLLIPYLFSNNLANKLQ
jgi:hypothetical protein